MAYRLILFLLCISTSIGYAQRLERAEYFFDSDPGAGNGTALNITAGDSIQVQANISIASLQEGMHRMFIRVQDSAGVWSMYEAQSFYIYPEEIFTSPLLSGETFSGTEPTTGSGQPFLFTKADSVDETFSRSTTGWNTGRHTVSIRVKDSLQRWSLYESREVYVYDSISLNSSLIRAEYFYNTDPGYGLGTPISFSTTDSVMWNALSLPVTGLPQGRHMVHLRFLNTYGQWGQYESASFFIAEEEQPSPILTQAEYFFDTLDPGMGNATALFFLAGDSVDITRTLPVNALDTGWHQLHLRIKDAGGRWSLYETFAFYVCEDFPRAAFGFTQFGLTVNFNNTSVGATRYQWNYGNGVQSSQVSPTYSYPSAGAYLVKLFAFNGNCPVKDSSLAFVGISPAFTVSVQNTQVCTNDSMRLSIATTESFAANNQFYIYLSDSTGSFSNSTLLDVLTARSSLLHAVYVPVFIARGSRYRVRIEATSPNSLSADNGADISVYPVTFSSFTHNGDTIKCLGEQLLLSGISGTSLSYQWFKNGNPLQGATIREFPAFSEGVYRLQVTNVWGCRNLSDEKVNLLIKPIPVTPEITGTTLVGRNALATYQVNPATTGSTYQWTISGGTQIAGGNGHIISVQWGNNPVLGKVEVIETGLNGCSGETKSLQVSVALSSTSLHTEAILVYPNPFEREITITLPATCDKAFDVQLFDSKGEVLVQTTWQASLSGRSQQILLPQLPSGVYTLRLRSEEQLFIQRLIRY